MEKFNRTLTKFQEAQLAFALSDRGNFDLAVRICISNGVRVFREDAVLRCWDAFVREGICEKVREGNLTHLEFTCKARDYIDKYHCTTDYLYR